MNNSTKNGCVLVLVMLLSVSGCGKKKQTEKATPKKVTAAEVSMPTAHIDEVQSVFDDDIAEFALVDEVQPQDMKLAQMDVPQSDEDKEEELINEFSWIEEEEKRNEDIKTVYFDFDKYSIRKDQETVVAHNIDTIKNALAKEASGKNKAVVVVEGNACSSAGSAAYNMALSEKRAKVLADRLTHAGIPQNQVKIVGRGQEYPVRDNQGKPLTGNREQQAPNRRDEINIIYV